MTSSDFVRSGVPQCKVVGQSRAAGSPVPLTRPNTTFCLLESIFNANYEQIKRIYYKKIFVEENLERFDCGCGGGSECDCVRQ